MPVGTAGAMKGITHEDLLTLGAQILLCNTYHLHLHPGEDTVAKAGGLHPFIHWEKPILTDSGGFQVFSLAKLRSIDDTGVTFRSHVDGSEHRLTPASAIEIQNKLGSDIILCLDQCPPSTAKRSEILEATDRTLKWAAECKEAHESLKKQHKRNPLLFCVIQGGLERDLREKCAQEMINIGFDGYAIGGLAVGESAEEMYGVLDVVCPLLPKDKLRYLMGVGVIEQLKKCVAKGIDMFDCVLPMRIARHGTILLSSGKSLDIDKAVFRGDFAPIDPDSPSPLSRKHSRAYLHHLVKVKERYGETIACMQNLGVTLRAMETLRETMDNE
ncbi:MAG: queuine tRNA-ribosyltransferase [Candidatus Peregrinibacteria bacterium Greene0416_62]|nr:MAG: queuine tRNA-ribosyltransferase [Candidatus Peregrinibacteria bacterium Greene0416_62]TSC98123.1 MAG: queuine tRNA-ribosyltransferase [Candidatus Peregrinibacteria bacterium Greene1014_49]